MHPKELVQTTNEKRSARLGPSEDYAQGQAYFENGEFTAERTGLPLIGCISQKGAQGMMFDKGRPLTRGFDLRNGHGRHPPVGPRREGKTGRRHDLALLTQWIDVNRDHTDRLLEWEYRIH